MKCIENTARRYLQVVEAFAFRRVSDGHGSWLGRQDAEPSQLVPANFKRFTGLSIDCYLQIRQRNDLRRQWHEHFAFAAVRRIKRLQFCRELGGVDGLRFGCPDTES